MEESMIREILGKYNAGTASAEEKAFVDAYFNAFDGRPDIISELTEEELVKLEHKMYGELSGRMHSPTPVVPLRRNNNKQIWWAAAAILLLLAAGTWWWKGDNSSGVRQDGVAAIHEISAGSAGAILTLADGSQVVLDSMDNNVVAAQNGAKAVVKNGVLVYDKTGPATGEITYNTMHTPRGRQYALLLSDGTRVWLNAASSLRFPTVFEGNERRVEVTGEAYFEVAKNAAVPFRVNVRGRAEIAVLGTHFNINAYENEASISTTLLEGAIAVSVPAGGKQHPGINRAVLRPGQQALISGQPSAQRIRVTDEADPGKAIAWKNGLFNFKNATLDEIMRQLERWYDIDVVYAQGVPDVQLTGKLTRGVSLNALLPALEKMGVHYKLEGRKLTIIQ